MSRNIALKILNDIEKRKSFSNISINKSLSSNNITNQEKSFISIIVYGIIERKITLDYIIDKYCKFSIKNINYNILNILRIGIYQLLYLDGVKDFAAVNETVNLSKTKKDKKASGFINGVLRNFLRDNKQYTLPNKLKNKLFYYSIKYSSPEWIIQKFINQYGEDNMISILSKSIGKPPLFIRVNSLKIQINDFIKLLEEENIEYNIIKDIPNALELKNITSIENMYLYKKGYFYVQDLSSQILCKIISPNKNDFLLDICAAPGGKSFTLAQYMENIGSIKSFDIYNNRLGLIEKGAVRLGIDIIKTDINDGEIYDKDIPLADKVLCDVPCFGLGIIRRKPEIKYKLEKDIYTLNKIQYNILENSSSYVKLGGYLYYSTCSLTKEENENMVDKFLKNNNNFKPENLNINLSFIEKNNYFQTFLPNIFDTDGFFIAKFKKVN